MKNSKKSFEYPSKNQIIYKEKNFRLLSDSLTAIFYAEDNKASYLKHSMKENVSHGFYKLKWSSSKMAIDKLLWTCKNSGNIAITDDSDKSIDEWPAS